MASRGYGASRLGRPDLKELELTPADLDRAAKDEELQVVDVTDVPGPHAAGGGFGGHGYWYANDWIMTDLLVAFRWQIPAEERGLVRRPGKARWYFPKDYPEKITAALRRRLQESTGGDADGVGRRRARHVADGGADGRCGANEELIEP